MTRWGKAGQRLTANEAQNRDARIRSQRNRDQTARQADETAARRMWAVGEVKPYAITIALDAMGLEGPEVALACGAREPDVDQWESGKLYPTWEQLVLLGELTGNTPRYFCLREPPLRIEQTSLRFHLPEPYDEPPTVLSYPAEVVAATVRAQKQP